MTRNHYKKQVALLLNVLPEVAKENCFALHGGTAINLFIRDMPRISVDIDLTYLIVEDRSLSLKNIAAALERIKARIEKKYPAGRIQHKQDVGKLLISIQGVDIKIEVNLINRGTLAIPEKRVLCDKAQEEYNAFCAISVVPHGQLYGGKICAALDRQHPRDLFDVKYLFQTEGFSQEVKKGFLLGLISGDRPIHEALSPNFLDQRTALTNQFEGMTDESFTYDDYESTREKLISYVHQGLTEEDKSFLLSVKNLTPDWTIYDFEKFPAVKWKLYNIRKLKDSNPDKYLKQYQALEEILNP